jgi:hypothetical protein
MSGHPDLTGARWRTSTYTVQNEACVEVGPTDEVIAVRDSKNRGGPALVFADREWSAFLNTIKSGDLDLG